VVPGVEAFDAGIDRRSDFYRLQALSHVSDHPPVRQSLLVRARARRRARLSPPRPPAPRKRLCSQIALP
jgi:hypothetical protein